MSRIPVYFRGTKPSGRAVKEARKRLSGAPPVNYMGVNEVRRTLLTLCTIAAVIGIGALLVVRAVDQGRFGAWASWHGEVWSVDDLVRYLGRQGMMFEAEVAHDVRDPGAKRLKFEGFDEMLESVQQDSQNMRMEQFRMENLKRFTHCVYVARFDPQHGVPQLATDEFLGGSWSWGNFIFRGDSRHINEIRDALQ